jgi:hypothetical protein
MGGCPENALRKTGENDRLGSLAALHHHYSPTAAIGGKADAHQEIFSRLNLNDCFHQKQPFKS